MDIKDLKPNSNTYKNSRLKEEGLDNPILLPPRRKVRKVSLIRKILSFIFADDIDDMGGDILFDFILPRAKDFTFDLITNSAERAVYGKNVRGGRGSARRSAGDGRTYISYNSYSKTDRRDEHRNEYTRHGFIPDRDLEFDTEGEATDCLDDMVEILTSYGVVKVSEYYELRKRTTPNRYVDRSFGWTDLRGAKIVRLRGGIYLLDLPKYVDLDIEDRR